MSTIDCKAMPQDEIKDVRIPQWAIDYIEYGEGADLNSEEVTQVDAFLALYTILEYPGDTCEFDINPEFGLPCSTVSATVEARF